MPEPHEHIPCPVADYLVQPVRQYHVAAIWNVEPIDTKFCGIDYVGDTSELVNFWCGERPVILVNGHRYVWLVRSVRSAVPPRCDVIV
jgi:hypothetical protein